MIAMPAVCAAENKPITAIIVEIPICPCVEEARLTASPDAPTKANRIANNQMIRTGLSEDKSKASAARDSRLKTEYLVSPAVRASRS